MTLVSPSGFINQLIIYALITSTVLTSAPSGAIVFPGFARSTHCSQAGTRDPNKTPSVVAGRRHGTLRELSEQPRKEREVTAHTGKLGTMERRRHLAHREGGREGGGSGETQVQEDNHKGEKADETDRRPEWIWKWTKSQDHLVLQTL